MVMSSAQHWGLITAAHTASAPNGTSQHTYKSLLPFRVWLQVQHSSGAHKQDSADRAKGRSNSATSTWNSSCSFTPLRSSSMQPEAALGRSSGMEAKLKPSAGNAATAFYSCLKWRLVNVASNSPTVCIHIRCPQQEQGFVLGLNIRPIPTPTLVK